MTLHPLEMTVPPSQLLDRVVDFSPNFTLTPVTKLVNSLPMEDVTGMETDMTLKRTVLSSVEVSNRCVLLSYECTYAPQSLK